jgi:hypothetical protein
MAENKSGQRFSLSERHVGPLSAVVEVCIVAFERHLSDVEWAKQAGLAPGDLIRFCSDSRESGNSAGFPSWAEQRAWARLPASTSAKPYFLTLASWPGQRPSWSEQRG